MFVLAYGGIAVTNCTGGNEDEGAGGEFDDEVEFFENKMAAGPGVVVSQRPYSAPALGNVLGVAVTTRAAAGSDVEGTGGPDAVREGRLAGGVVFVQGFELGGVISMHLGGVRMESSC